MVHPVKLLHRLPTDMTFQQGALLEPLSVSLQAVRNANVQLGSPALVCGAGPIGLLALTCLRAAGAWPIVVTDIDRTRLKTAEEVVTGVGTHWVNTAEQPSAVASEVRKLFAQLNRSGAGTDKADKGETVAPVAVIECTGISSSITTACHAVRKAGTVMVVGAGESSVDNFPAAVIMSKEVRSPNLR
jgi:L-iditol 2-dehydrogenase